jgi:hypothetical protein
MAFSEKTKDPAYDRAGGQWECMRPICGHEGRSSKAFGRYGTWEAHHIRTSGGDTLSNCEVLCSYCCLNTRRYGRSCHGR